MQRLTLLSTPLAALMRKFGATDEQIMEAVKAEQDDLARLIEQCKRDEEVKLSFAGKRSKGDRHRNRRYRWSEG